MKKIFLMTALSVAMFGMASAQTAAATTSKTSTTQAQLPQVRAKAMVSKINNACGLQGDQVGKVNTLYIEYYTKLDAIGKDAAQVKELNKTVDAALKGILTPSQQKFWSEAAAK